MRVPVRVRVRVHVHVRVRVHVHVYVYERSCKFLETQACANVMRDYFLEVELSLNKFK